jgi:hypothetical protein
MPQMTARPGTAVLFASFAKILRVLCGKSIRLSKTAKVARSNAKFRKENRLLRVSAMLCCVLLGAPAAFALSPADDKLISLTVPAAPWTLTLPAGDFKVTEREIKPDGSSGYFYLTGEKSRINISLFIEPVSECKDSKSCRDMVWKVGNPLWENPQNVVSAEIGDVSYFEFFMPKFRNMDFQQQNLYAEFVVDGFWVDCHISKVFYKPEEHALFEQLVKSVKFEPKEKKAGASGILQQR